MLFAAKGVDAALRIGVGSVAADAHAWVEVGDFVLDDQRISAQFKAFAPPVRSSEDSRA